MSLQYFGLQNPVDYSRVTCTQCGYDWVSGKQHPTCPKCAHVLYTNREGETKMATTKPEAKTENKNGPAKKYRAGAIEVSVWKNTMKTDKGVEYDKYSASIQRSYKDKNDEWQKTASMNLNDLPKLITLLQKAFDELTVTKEE